MILDGNENNLAFLEMNEIGERRKLSLVDKKISGHPYKYTRELGKSLAKLLFKDSRHP